MQLFLYAQFWFHSVQCMRYVLLSEGENKNAMLVCFDFNEEKLFVSQDSMQTGCMIPSQC